MIIHACWSKWELLVSKDDQNEINDENYDNDDGDDNEDVAYYGDDDGDDDDEDHDDDHDEDNDDDDDGQGECGSSRGFMPASAPGSTQWVSHLPRKQVVIIINLINLGKPH